MRMLDPSSSPIPPEIPDFHAAAITSSRAGNDNNFVTTQTKNRRYTTTSPLSHPKIIPPPAPTAAAILKIAVLRASNSIPYRLQTPPFARPGIIGTKRNPFPVHQ
jgi:hypothetical protein